MNIITYLINRHLNRNADMQRRRAERQHRAELWAAMDDGAGFTASTPQPPERELPPKRRYTRATWFSEN